MDYDGHDRGIFRPVNYKHKSNIQRLKNKTEKKFTLNGKHKKRPASAGRSFMLITEVLLSR
jgi:hypothetical protein